MTSIASIFARRLTRAAGLQLNATGEVMQNGNALYRLNHPAADKIPDCAYFELLDWVRLHTGDQPDLVFRYAREIRNNDLGALGLAAKSAPTLRDSLLRLERYFRLLTDNAVYRLKEDTDPALFILEARTPDHPALQLRDECALAGVADNIREFGRTISNSSTSPSNMDAAAILRRSKPSSDARSCSVQATAQSQSRRKPSTSQTSWGIGASLIFSRNTSIVKFNGSQIWPP